MPPVVGIVAAAAGSAVAGAGLGGALFGAGILGSFGQAVLADAAFGALTSFAVNQIGSRALTKKPKAPAGIDQGIKTVVRLSDANQKIIYGRARIGGVLVYVNSTDSGEDDSGEARTGNNMFLHMVIALAGHEIDEIEELYLNDDLVTLDGFGFVNEDKWRRDFKKVRITKHLGTDDQLADPLLAAECPNWTSDHRLRGIPYLYVRLQYHAEIFITGIPTVNAVVKGKKVYDPRDIDQDPDDKTTWAWSDNAALCIRDYLYSRDAGDLPYGFGALNAEIDDTFTAAAANICDETITKLDGSTIDRYACNGAVDTSSAPLDNLQGLVSALAGAVTTPKGMFRIYAGAYDTPETTVIDESMLSGNIKSRNRIPRQQLFNAVRGTYVSSINGWQPTDFPPITSDLYEEEDNGERIFTDLELPYTTDGEAAQRIAKLIQRKGREQITVNMALSHKGMQFAVWDTVKVTNTKRGWTEKVFRIESLTFELQAGVVVQLREENPEAYDWSASDAEAEEAAPDTGLPDAFNVAPPRALEVEEDTYVTRDGAGVKASAIMTWLASPDAFLLEYQAEYKTSTATDWTLLPRTVDVTITVFDIDPGVYDFRVKAINTLGVASPYSTATKQISGLLDPPTEPQNLTISTIGGLAIIRWDQSPDVDVRIGGHYVFRHSPDESATWNQTTTIGNVVPGSHTIAVLPLKPGVYLAKAVDSSAIESVDHAAVTTDQATSLAYANVDSITEDPGFTGTKTGVLLDGSTIKLSGSGQFDGIADFDAVPDLDGFGGSLTEGTYEFSAGIDLGLVQHIRLTGHVLAAVTQIFDTIDSRIALIDDWEFFDGDNAAEGDAILYARHTPDDPAGSPVWSEWNRLDSGEFNDRAFEFKLEMMVTDATYNIVVSELSVTADEVS